MCCVGVVWVVDLNDYDVDVKWILLVVDFGGLLINCGKCEEVLSMFVCVDDFVVRYGVLEYLCFEFLLCLGMFYFGFDDVLVL